MDSNNKEKYWTVIKGSPITLRCCALCMRAFEPGELYCLVPVKPSSKEDEEKMKKGKCYIAEAELAHEKCYDVLKRPEYYTSHVTEKGV